MYTNRAHQDVPDCYATRHVEACMGCEWQDSCEYLYNHPPIRHGMSNSVQLLDDTDVPLVEPEASSIPESWDLALQVLRRLATISDDSWRFLREWLAFGQGFSYSAMARAQGVTRCHVLRRARKLFVEIPELAQFFPRRKKQGQQ